MRPSLVFLLFVFLSVTSAALLSAPPVSLSTESRAVDAETLARVTESLPAQEREVRNKAEVVLPLTKRRLTTSKIIVKGTDRVTEATTDEQGKAVNISELLRVEEGAYNAKYGNLDPQLYEILQRRGPEERLRVGFWINLPDAVLADRNLRYENMKLSDRQATQLNARRKEQVRKAAAAATSSLRTYLEREMKLKVSNKPEQTITPVVFAYASAREIETIAKQRKEIHRVYFAENKFEDYLEVAIPTIKANDVWAAGYTGTNGRVAIVEDSRVDFDNNCLATNLGTRVPGDGNVDQHATTCAGMVISNNATRRGVAYGAGIYSANGTTYDDDNMSDALDAATSNADVLNNSWGPQCGAADGSMDLHARQADYIVRVLWDDVVAAAGNNGDCASGKFVDGVGLGYNVIAVGNFDDKNTNSLGDDSMSSSSSFDDPDTTHDDRQKPEVAAPGTNINSLMLASPGTCPTGAVGSGTSYASPMVSGIAALLEHRVSSLKVYPEATKALILAGARHNIEGSARLSNKDGAGGVDAKASFDSAANDRYRWLYLTTSSFDGSGNYTITTGSIPKGSRVKIALAWDSTPNSSYSSDPLKADLDLWITGPGGFAQYSLSWDNSYEIVDFTAPATGSYTIKVHKFRFDGSVEYAGVAWTY